MRLRACGTMEAKIMKYHFLSWFTGRILEKDQDQAELLYVYSFTRISENDSKSWFIVSRVCIFLSNICLAHLLFASFPSVLKKREKFTLYHLHMI